MINKIWEELDRMMDAQEREIEIDMETEDESKVYFETAKLFAYREVEKIIMCPGSGIFHGHTNGY